MLLSAFQSPHSAIVLRHAVHHAWLPGQSHHGSTGLNTVLWAVRGGAVTVRSGKREWHMAGGEAFLYRFPDHREVWTAEGADWYSMGISAHLFETLDLTLCLPIPALWKPSPGQWRALEFHFEQARRILGGAGYPPFQADNFSQAFQIQYLRRSQLNALDTIELQGAAQTLFALLWKQLSPDVSLESVALGRFPDWMPRLIDLRRERPEIAVEELARELGMSRRQLVREFQQWFGQPPRRYLNYLRLEEARQMLITTPMPLGQIADRCGFVSVPHFVRLFSQEYGSPPGAYRQQQEKSSPL